MSDIQLTPEGSPGAPFPIPPEVLNQGGKPPPGQNPLAPQTDSRLTALESTTSDTLTRVTNLENGV